MHISNTGGRSHQRGGFGSGANPGSAKQSVILRPDYDGDMPEPATVRILMRDGVPCDEIVPVEQERMISQWPNRRVAQA